MTNLSQWRHQDILYTFTDLSTCFLRLTGNHRRFFFCGWKITKLDFCIFSESLLERSHRLTLFSSVFILCFIK